MTERLIETLRDGGSLVLTTDEAKSKAEALEAGGFVAIDLTTLPQPEWQEERYGNKRFALGAVSVKTNWADDEEIQAYAERHMQIALDHIAAARWVLENPPPKRPEYREERKLLLTWLDSKTRFPEPDQHYTAYHDLVEKTARGDVPQGTQVLDVVKVDGGYRHLYGMAVSHRVLVEEEAA